VSDQAYHISRVDSKYDPFFSVGGYINIGAIKNPLDGAIYPALFTSYVVSFRGLALVARSAKHSRGRKTAAARSAKHSRVANGGWGEISNTPGRSHTALGGSGTQTAAVRLSGIFGSQSGLKRRLATPPVSFSPPPKQGFTTLPHSPTESLLVLGGNFGYLVDPVSGENLVMPKYVIKDLQVLFACALALIPNFPQRFKQWMDKMLSYGPEGTTARVSGAV